ncbi:MAG: hypothetical protein ACRDNF_26275 [Streptosporangiaceae bacterium]
MEPRHRPLGFPPGRTRIPRAAAGRADLDRHPGGRSEEIVGRAIKDRRDAVEAEILPACERHGMGTLIWSKFDGHR